MTYIDEYYEAAGMNGHRAGDESEPEGDASARPHATGRGAQLVRASSITIGRPTWVWDRRVPVAGVTLVAGREGMGKTALLGHLTARLTRGQLPGVFLDRPADVVYVGDEDDRASVLVPRLVAAGADLDRVHFMDLPAGVPFSIEEDVDELDELLAPLEIALVVIDPVDSHLGSGVDSHRKAEVQRAIGTLAVLAQKHRCGIAGLAHLNKGDARDLLTRVVGSVGFTTSVRSVLGVGEHPADERDRVAVLGKSNLTDKTSVPALRFRVEGVEVDHPDGGTVDTAGVVILGEEHGIDPHSIVSGLGHEERTERDDAAEWLADILGAGPMPLKEIQRLARDENISRATLFRAKPQAGVEADRDENARGRPATWRLSSHAIQSHAFTLSRETKSNPCDERAAGPLGGVWSQVRECETESGFGPPPTADVEGAGLVSDVLRRRNGASSNLNPQPGVDR